MITKEQLTKLFHWGNKTTFPLRKEGITSKYMGYDVFVSYAKYGKNEKRYRKKLFDDDIYEIIKSDEIYGVAYLKYSAQVDAKPHKDFNLWGKDFLRIQIPLKIPEGNKCYIEFIETGERFYWQEGKVEIFNVEKLHQGKNDSDETMEFLYVDINPDTKVEL